MIVIAVCICLSSTWLKWCYNLVPRLYGLTTLYDRRGNKKTSRSVRLWLTLTARGIFRVEWLSALFILYRFCKCRAITIFLARYDYLHRTDKTPHQPSYLSVSYRRYECKGMLVALADIILFWQEAVRVSIYATCTDTNNRKY